MFSSPLFWQIQYLVTTLSKKNYKGNVGELNQLVVLYGEDARAFLIHCLLEDIDFGDQRAGNQKDAPKVAVLTQQLMHVLLKPNYVTTLCEAFGVERQPTIQRSSLPVELNEEFLSNVCRTARLSASQTIGIALALAHSIDTMVQKEATKLLVSRVPQLVSFEDVHEDVMVNSIHFVASSEELANDARIVEFITRAAQSTPDGLNWVTAPILEILNKTGVDIEMNDPSPRKLNDLCGVLTSNVSLASILTEFGYQCTSSVETLRSAIIEVGVPITEQQVAELFAAVATARTKSSYTGASSGSENVGAIYTLLGQDAEESSSLEGKEQWQLDVIARVLREDFATLNWTIVARNLDLPESLLHVSTSDSFDTIARLFKSITGRVFPLQVLFEENWRYPLAQFQLLRYAITAVPDLVDFPGIGMNIQPFPDETQVAIPRNRSWLCLPLYTSLMQLATKIPSRYIMQVFEAEIGNYPEYIVCGLAECSFPGNGVRAELLGRTLPLFSTPTRPSALLVLRRLAEKNESLVILLCRKLLAQATTKSQVLDVDNLLKTLSSSANINLSSQMESEARVAELLPFWCVLADLGSVDLSAMVDKAIATDAPSTSNVISLFLRKHMASLRVQRESNGSVLSLDSASFLVRILQQNAVHVGQDAVSELSQQLGKRMATAGAGTASVSANSNPMDLGLGHRASGGESKQTGGSGESEDVEEEANSYFQRIYTSDMSIAEVIQLLKRFKSSSDSRETEIFRCMIHNLFDEYRFFHKYPDKELQVTGRLFGTLIQHQLVSSITLGIALRYVLEALKKDPTQGGHNEKMFSFGKIALEQFKSRLVEWPQYCSHLVQIEHLRAMHPDLYQVAHSAMNGVQDISQRPETQMGRSTDASDMQVMSAGSDGPSASDMYSSPPPPTSESSASVSTQPQSGFQDIHSELAAIAGSQGFPERKEETGLGLGLVSRERISELDRLLKVHGELPPAPIPPENICDQIYFIFNNLSKSNMEVKCKELKDLLRDEYYAWLGQYLVSKRITAQPNLHPQYLAALDKIDASELNRHILVTVYHSVAKLFASPKIIGATSNDRSLLRSLGMWLGQFTLALNKPILQRHLDMKELLLWGYETGRLMPVCSFVSKVLEGCKDSKIFKYPNPWLLGLLSVMKELYNVEDLKINIKFEVEVLCKNIGLKIEDISASACLHTRRAPTKEKSADFTLRQPVAPVAGQNVVPVTPLGPDSVDASPEFKPEPVPAEATVPEQTVIPHLRQHVTISPTVAFFIKYPQMKNIVPIAVDRAIREIIQPVVDRSVTIALVTSRELVLKDFALEPHEVTLRHAAHLIISNLAGSLALVTCKEPLRVSMGNHLRSLLTQATQDQNMIEQVVQVCSNDNLELGCMLIEKAATEKAVRDVDEALTSSYQTRKKHREQNPGQPFVDMSVVNKSGRYPRDLPEPLKPRAPPHQQIMVYEMFQRPRASLTQPRASTIPPLATAPSAGAGQLNPNPNTTPIATLSMSQAIEAYQNVLMRIDQSISHVLHAHVHSHAQPVNVTLSMLGDEHELFPLMREVITITQRTQTHVRDESAITFAEVVFKRLMETHMTELLPLEVYVGILEALRDACGSKNFTPDILSWLNNYAAVNMADDISKKIHSTVLMFLMRPKILKLPDVDAYLCRHMDQGRNGPWVEFTLQFVRQCVTTSDGTPSDFVNSIEVITRLRAHQPANQNTAVKRAINKWLVDIGAVKDEAKQVIPAAAISPPGPVAAASAERWREHVGSLLEAWLRIWNSGNENLYSSFLQQLHSRGVLKTEESANHFFKAATELCVDACLKSQQTQQHSQSSPPERSAQSQLSYTVLDALSRLFLLLVRLADKDPSSESTRVNLLNRLLSMIALTLIEDHDSKKSSPSATTFDQRPYYRLFLNLLTDIGTFDPKQEPNPAMLQVLFVFAQIFYQLHPGALPGFAFAWLELVSHRNFMPHLLHPKDSKGSAIMHQLLVRLLVFLQPFLKTVSLTDAIRKLFKGTLRVLLVLLHDFPEFLCEYHLSFCDVIPSTCVQLRNLVLSAFPRSMRLPDPFTPNLKVDLLPEIRAEPKIKTDYQAPLNERGLRQRLDAFLASRQPSTFLQQLPSLLMTGVHGSHNLPLITSVVVHVGSHAILQMATKQALQTSAAMDIYQYLVTTLDPEGRYHLLNAIANQLRYPNNHTHYFSCVLLYLFIEARDEVVKEQITRVLLERLIVHRPHPWGLLITFIELIKNPRYEFWRQPFTRCAPEIEKVFESVARSCIGSQSSISQHAPQSEGQLPMGAVLGEGSSSSLP